MACDGSFIQLKTLQEKYKYNYLFIVLPTSESLSLRGYIYTNVYFNLSCTNEFTCLTMGMFHRFPFGTDLHFMSHRSAISTSPP